MIVQEHIMTAEWANTITVGLNVIEVVWIGQLL